MENLQQATEKICELYGTVLSLRTLMAALIQVLPPDALPPLASQFDRDIENLKAELLGTRISEHVIDACERDSQLLSAMIAARIR